MTELELERKATLRCPDCGAPSSETSIRCERHRQAAAERWSRWAARERPARRRRRRCAFCARPSRRYGCTVCRRQQGC